MDRSKNVPKTVTGIFFLKGLKNYEQLENENILISQCSTRSFTLFL